jgi:hypothetical protein
MIQEWDAQDLGGIFEPTSDLAILRAWIEMARWVIMGYNYCDRVILDSSNENFAWVNDCAIHETNRDQVNLQNIVAA